MFHTSKPPIDRGILLRLQLHGEAFLEEGIRVTSAAAEADHGILLIGLVLLATNQALVPIVNNGKMCGKRQPKLMVLGLLFKIYSNLGISWTVA